MLQAHTLSRTQEILEQQEQGLQRTVQKLEQKAGVQVSEATTALNMMFTQLHCS